MVEKEVHLGGQTRAMRFTPIAMMLAQKLLNGRSPRVALAVDCDMDVVATVAACAMREAEGDAKTKSKIDPRRVATWIGREPAAYQPLKAAVLEGATAYYEAIGELDKDDDEGGVSELG